MRRLVLLSAIVTIGCSKPAPRVETNDAAPLTSTAATLASATPDAAAPPSPLYLTFSGPTGAKTSFRVAFERTGSNLRAVFDTGAPIAMIGRMTDDAHFSVHAANVPKGEKPTILSGEFSATALKATFSDPDGKLRPIVSEGVGAVPSNFDEEYLGKIGKLFVRMKLTHKGGKISGLYRYSASTTDLRLEGSVLEDGRFELTESISGKTTGKLVGAFATKAGVIGQWRSPDGSRSLPVSLEHGSGYPESASYDNGIFLYPQEKVIEGQRCKFDAVFAQLRGGSDARALKELNVFLRGENGKAKSCEGPDDPELPDFESEEGYSLDTKRGRFIGIRRTGWAYAGGVHGSGGSECNVIDTKTLTHFKLASKISPAGRAKVAESVIASFKSQFGVSRLTDAGFYEDTIEITDKSDLCLGDGFIDVDFDAYEIGPYALGPQSARMKTRDMADIFVKDAFSDALFGVK